MFYSEPGVRATLLPPPTLPLPSQPKQVYARGRVALVGDSAHLATPFLGQGCSQAFEDALELGRAVGELAVGLLVC